MKRNVDLTANRMFSGGSRVWLLHPREKFPWDKVFRERCSGRREIILTGCKKEREEKILNIKFENYDMDGQCVRCGVELPPMPWGSVSYDMCMNCDFNIDTKGSWRKIKQQHSIDDTDDVVVRTMNVQN